ncbi:flagellar hook assembly protein FlgD [Pararhizobium mangrovi]|uniref:Basal-body rod modification protein FlgD n=1 Tax=Pararhizobium mangrovi TaxID=2590452 RepID=A0A506U016_9HYPH|nr:flagellar hook assembly protein FlgD [Pararhizobium mangrovi]TPW26906.1 flagellar hook assembly protein FlgD [Pararhizobium mangrovi]
MAVSAAAGVAQTQTQTSADANKSDQASSALNVDYNTFLKLLIAQMNNQDPTDPMDATQQVQQLATFSQVEQTIQTNKHLETLLSQSALSDAGSAIGRTLTSADGETSGVVKQVAMKDGTLTAVLEGGQQIDIADGVTIE